VLGTVNLIAGQDGEQPLVSVILRDQTHVRALQERLVRAERMEAVGELAAGISHDVNNVLAAVSGYAQLLGSRLEDPDLVRHLDGIFRSVRRASDLVTQLLAFARQQHLEPTDVEPCSVVEDLEDMLQRLLPAGVELAVDCRRVGLARVDPRQLQQVLLNLVLNARDAMPDGGLIRVQVDRHRGARGPGPPARRHVRPGHGH
jgi:two-component system cell cycle sensor histidine kinase/response regulator CckA